MNASIFPPPSPKGLPFFSTLLVTGSCHPSAPIHLALSLRAKSLIIHPSKSDFQADLIRFNDAWLVSRSGHGKITDLASKIDILYYPPSVAHLCMLLSVLCASDTGDVKPTHSTIKGGPPDVVILVELSKFFFSESKSEISTLSSYVNVIQRAMAFLSIHPTKRSPSATKVVLFESSLQELKAPLTRQPSSFSDHNPYQPRQMQALPIVEKYFETIGILEDDSLYVPSSQTDEVPSGKQVRRQLRLYHPDRPLDGYIHSRWSERICLTEGISGTWFLWPEVPEIQLELSDRLS